MKRKPTTDGLEILNSLFLEQDPELREMVEREHRKMRIAKLLYQLRKSKGLTQGQLARLVGTSTSVISRIEDANYDGHNLSTVERFCEALGYEFHADFKPQLAVSWTGSSVRGETESALAMAVLQGTWSEFSFPRDTVSEPTVGGEESLKLTA